MLTIIHGNDYVASRNLFNQEKDKESLTIDASNLTFPLDQLLSGSTLFHQKQKVFIENAFNKKAVKNLDEIISFANKAQDLNLYILSDKELSKTQLKDFSKFSEKIFKIPQNIFSFVDNITPSSPNNVINFHNTLSYSTPEFVFTMIVRQFRLMLGLLGDTGKNIDEVTRLQGWQSGKLKRQSLLFGEEKIKSIYKKLYFIEKSQKTGSGKLNLIQAIDMLLLEL